MEQKEVSAGTARSSTALLVPLLDARWKTVYVSAAIAVLLFGWAYSIWWWAVVAHPTLNSWRVLDCVMLLLLLWEALNQSWQMLYLRGVVINPALEAPKFRVAMIATKVPSEPLYMLQRTLRAMLSQDYKHPYDVWLADENPTQETKDWCAENGIRVSCRLGVEEYHRTEWPRRTRCKEGNLAYFYDNWGYGAYDVVAQFDADHVPSANYLSTVLPAFLDPDVGYVALPSICSSNEAESWAARGRLYMEAVMHGPWGASCSRWWLPCCIGSHYVVRTKYLQAAGGIGPELDEDLSTSYIMTSNGFKGVFAMNTIAIGDGPATFEDAMIQEYQWARSAIMLLLRYTSPWWQGLTWREKMRMVFWYGVWFAIPLQACVGAYTLTLSGLLPRFGPSVNIVAMWRDAGWALLLPQCAGLMIALLACTQGWLRPSYAPVISWEAILHRFALPWWQLKGVVHALLGAMFGVHFNIRVTPKGDNGARLLPLTCLLPFWTNALAACLVATCTNATNPKYQALWFSAHMTAMTSITLLHYKENHFVKGGSLPVAQTLKLCAMLGAAAAAGAAMFVVRGQDIWDLTLAPFHTEVLLSK